MSRLKFKIGDQVYAGSQVRADGQDEPVICRVHRIEPALEQPYFLNDGNWYGEGDLQLYTPPTPTWDEVEAYNKQIVKELRQKFDEHDQSELRFVVKATGRTHGDIKIEYSIDNNAYESANVVKGYSLRPVLDEFFRRFTWKARNAPVAITYSGDEKEDETVY